jgi:Dolichyl-phosphate-mannose-protein mannosyltransferase
VRRIPGSLVLLACGGLALWLTSALVDLHGRGDRWLWRQVALGATVVFIWSVGRLRRGDGFAIRGLLPLLCSLVPLVFALVKSEGADSYGAVRVALWLVVALVMAIEWRRMAGSSFGLGAIRLAGDLWAAIARRTLVLALAAFVLGAGISAFRTSRYLDQIPAVTGHDAFCYVLQARTFLEGRAANPTHPHWEFFQAFHVVTWPFHQAKYPPGYALTLAGGMATGLGRFVPAILMGLVALGTFLIGRRLFGPGPAALAVIWLAVIPEFSRLGTMHLSNPAAVAAGVWLLHVFLVSRERPRRWWPYVVGGLIAGYFILVRPLDAILFAGPVLLLWTILTVRRFDLPAAAGRIALLGLACSSGLVVMAIYNRAVTGTALSLPYSVYDRQYKRTGFRGARNAPLLRTEPIRRPHQRWQQDERDYGSTFGATPIPDHLEEMPARIELQLKFFGMDVHHAGLLFAALPLALLALGRRRVGGLLLLALIYWIGYCVSSARASRYIWPVFPLVLLAVTGGAALIRREERPGFGWLGSLVPLSVILLACSAVALVPGLDDRSENDPYHRLLQIAHSAPGETKLVFLDYDGWHRRQEYVYNGPNIDEDPIVFAHDLKERNGELMAYYPERHVYLYVLKDAQMRLIRWPIREGD